MPASSEQPEPPEQPAGPLVSTADLRRLLDAGTPVTVLDVRYRLGAPEGEPVHAAGHVPGAAYVDLDTALAAPPGTGGRHPLPEPAVFLAAMRDAGVRAECPVVVFDDWSGHAAARAWWLLRHHGHRDVRVLDGGWSSWVADGGPVETGPVTPEPGDLAGEPGHMPVVEADGVPVVEVLVDARAPERYRGETEPMDRVAGHVPGAVNVPTVANLTEDGRFRPVEEVRELYAAVGAVPGADVAAYCGSGVTACLDVLALELVGVRAALYPGSWSGWIADPAREVEVGGRGRRAPHPVSTRGSRLRPSVAPLARPPSTSPLTRPRHQWIPLKTRASMICSDSREPWASPRAAAESGNTW